MGDRPHYVPLLSDAVKDKVDVIAVPTAIVGWLGAIPWHTVAAILASVYTALRIAELVAHWMRKRK